MEKLNRLGWTEGFSFSAYGVRVGIRTNNADVIARIHALLPPRWKPLSALPVDRLYSVRVGGAEPGLRIRRFHILYADAARLARTTNLDELLELLESDLQLYVAERSRRKLFVHAGVVGWRGRAIVIPGRSFSGKTTLVAALVRAGATYYSDEYAVFDGQGRVHPFPKPLSIRGAPNSRQRKNSPEIFGGAPGAKPLPVGLVTVTKYRSGAQWKPRRLSPGEGVLSLFANTVPARRRPKAALAILHRVASGAVILKGSRSEAGEVVNYLLDGVKPWRAPGAPCSPQRRREREGSTENGAEA